jgi:protein tyrosine phosphatase (PTP) superfamily phosphohydrolase (DUF442 family)
MKLINFLILILLPLNAVLGSFSCNQDTPVLVNKSFNLYKHGNLYFSGQPDSLEFHYLDSLGVEMVINIRSSREVDYHTNNNFNEENLLDSLNISHVHIPLGGSEGYYPGAVDSLAGLLDGNNKKVLIHCKRGGRVTLLWMAYLVNSLGYTIDEAVALGDTMGFFFPLDDLLGYRVSFQKIE